MMARKNAGHFQRPMQFIMFPAWTAAFVPLCALLSFVLYSFGVVWPFLWALGLLVLILYASGYIEYRRGYRPGQLPGLLRRMIFPDRVVRTAGRRIPRIFGE